MTLPDERVLSLLQSSFVVGWRDIERERHCGSSRAYAKAQTALGTTNGAGSHNVQMFVLSEDLVVLHALPGFWHPEDLARELRFAQAMHVLWRDPTRSSAQKAAMFRRLHEHEIHSQTAATTARSTWQHFDRSAELQRLAQGHRDTFTYLGEGRFEIKPLNVLVHERMAQRPFVPFADFDVAQFVDYGREYYDNNAGFDEGRRFLTLERLRAKRAREARRQELRAAAQRRSRA